MTSLRRTSLRLLAIWIGIPIYVSGCNNLFDSDHHETALPLKVEYTGCRSVIRGPVCVLDDKRTLTIWTKTDRFAAINVSADENTRIQEPTLIQGGRRYVIEIGKTTPEITVEATLDNHRSAWRLKLSEPSQPAWLKKAIKLGRAGEIEKAGQVIQSNIEKAPVVLQAQAESLLARLSLGTGNTDKACKYFQAAIPKHKKLDRYTDLLFDTTALAHILTFNYNRIAQARELLKSLKEFSDRTSALEHFSLLYVEGELALRVGDLRTAMDRLNAAHLLAKRLDMIELSLSSGQELANLLQLLGRRTEASDLFDQLWREQPKDTHPCNRAILLNSQGWARILVQEAGESSLESPVSVLTEAYSIFEKTCPGMPKEKTNVMINLALAHLHSGDIKTASDYIAKASKTNPDPDIDFILWILEVEARLAQASQKPDKALLLYNKQQELAQHIQDPIGMWRSALGLARNFADMGKLKLAAKSYEQAEQLLDRASMWIGLGDGRAGFLAQHQLSTQEFISLLLSMKKPKEALGVARNARIRVFLDILRSNRLGKLTGKQRNHWDRAMRDYIEIRNKLDSQAALDWKLPADQLTLVRQARSQDYDRLRKTLDRAFFSKIKLPDFETFDKPKQTLAEDEMLLLYFPVGDKWIGFAEDRLGVQTADIGSVQPQKQRTLLPTMLLKPFSEHIKRNRKIRVLPMGEMSKVDFHALEWGNDILMRSKQVVYSLDLPKRFSSSQPRPKTANLKALIVIDPQSDLPEAGREAYTIQENLEKRKVPWLTILIRGEKATSKAFRLGLKDADLLHLSGHAVYRGFQGWDSALKLSGGAEFGIGDILTLDDPPKRVVLTGCETGRTAPSKTAGLGLAQAFLFAGSKVVIASSREIGDQLAAEFASALYANHNLEPVSEAAYRKALLSVKQRLPAEDWASLRIILP